MSQKNNNTSIWKSYSGDAHFYPGSFLSLKSFFKAFLLPLSLHLIYGTCCCHKKPLYQNNIPYLYLVSTLISYNVRGEIFT